MDEGSGPFGLSPRMTTGCGLVLVGILVIGIVVGVYSCSDAGRVMEAMEFGEPEDVEAELVKPTDAERSSSPGVGVRTEAPHASSSPPDLGRPTGSSDTVRSGDPGMTSSSQGSGSGHSHGPGGEELPADPGGVGPGGGGAADG